MSEDSQPATEIDQAEIESTNTGEDFNPAITVGKRGGILWKLTHVCYQWRVILIDSPSFWNTFRIINYSRSSARQVELCLSRSRDLPLRFSLKDDSNHSGSFDYDPRMFRNFNIWHRENLTPLLDLLYAQAHRWSKVFLAETNYPILVRDPRTPTIANPGQPAPNWHLLPPPPPSNFPTSFPNLHTLGLANTLDLRKLEMFHIFSLFTTTSVPALRHLILSKFGKTCPRHEDCSPQTALPASLNTFPWAQLTSLTFLDTSAFTSAMLVSKSLNITRLQVFTSFVYPFDRERTVYPEVILDKLRVYAIQVTAEEFNLHLDYVTAPSLEIFRVRRVPSGAEQHNSNELPGTITNFLRRSEFGGRDDIDYFCGDEDQVSTIFARL